MLYKPGTYYYGQQYNSSGDLIEILTNLILTYFIYILEYIIIDLNCMRK